MPVYLCFDALGVLTLDEAEFSDGNIGSSRANIGNSQSFFKAIPFHLVFHNEAFKPEERDEIVFRRHAEVLVPDRLSLEPHLKYVVCRSAAERQTLSHLLGSAWSRWESKVYVDTNRGFFERKWTYVERVVTSSDAPVIRFDFNPSATMPGPFGLRFTYQDRSNGMAYELVRNFDTLDGTLSIALQQADHGEVELWLDDALAFKGMVYFLPF